jgi:hypothetical protein
VAGLRNQTGYALIGVISVALIVSLMCAALFSITSSDNQEREIQSAWVRALALTQGTIEAISENEKGNNCKSKNWDCDNLHKYLTTTDYYNCDYYDNCSCDENGWLTVNVMCKVQFNSKGNKVATRIKAVIPPNSKGSGKSDDEHGNSDKK